ncbi:hypothetical protein [Chryseobacterium indoltheticum]|uniref:hypothetical protein n=1 Tax=Chryseobacterium indoltheticum TaxID=254 RepID=UPI003F492E18
MKITIHTDASEEGASALKYGNEGEVELSLMPEPATYFTKKKIPMPSHWRKLGTFRN